MLIDLLFLTGLALLATGLALVDIRLALVVTGVVLMLVALRLAAGRPPESAEGTPPAARRETR